MRPDCQGTAALHRQPASQPACFRTRVPQITCSTATNRTVETRALRCAFAVLVPIPLRDLICAAHGVRSLRE